MSRHSKIEELKAGATLCAPSISGLGDGPKVKQTRPIGRPMIGDDLYWSWAGSPSADAAHKDGADRRCAFWTWAGRG